MSEMNASALMGLLVPKIPFLLKTALLHTLSMSANSSKWDLRTELIINILRSELSKPNPSSISEQQRNSNKIPEVKGPMWVTKIAFPAPPEDDVRQKLLKAIDDMKTVGEEYTVPELLPVEGEWHGPRAGVPKTEPDPAIPEEEKYERMMKEVKTDAVVLYFHGGAYYLMDAASQRPATVRYAQAVSGRTFAVRYRLSPQNPFPAPILDALVAYLSLLYPPPGALHKPVPADKIILAGDSAGGNLALVLMQTLLQWQRSTPGLKSPTLNFHGKEVPVPLPGGMALASPWTDMTRALPSMDGNAHYDYLPGPHIFKEGRFPPCEAWPTKPPRAHLYCEGNAMLHPLTSPIVADWTGCPPTLIQAGEEMMADECKVVARNMARQGVAVSWQQFEAMPHCFALLLEENPSTAVFREAWYEFADAVVHKPETLHAKGEFVVAKSLAAKHVEVQLLTDLNDEKVVELMREAQKRLCEGDGTKMEEPPVV